MTEKSPLNFDLLIERFEDNYKARVVASPAGEAAGIFEATFDSLKLENFVLEASKGSQDSLRTGPVKKFGANLFDTVFTKDVFTSYMRSLDIARKDERGLRIRLRIDVPEFHNLPWEYLYNTQIKQFIALSNDTPIVRYFDLPFTTSTFAIKPPLKILVMLSSPKEYPALDLDQEWAKLNKALAPLIKNNLVKLERLKKPTLSQLQQSLRREDVHIFHYIGHGKFLERNQDGKLLLEQEDGKGLPVSGDQLGTILHDHESLRLVVLSACEGARTSSEDPFAGVAQTLVQQGIPAIIAMQVEILENASIHFAEEFFKSIVDGFSIDAAVAEGRKAIYSKGNETEWGTPVLFTRSPDSVLFQQIDASQKPATGNDAVVKKTDTKASGAKTPVISLSTLSKNPKVLYSGIFFVVAVLALIGGISFRNNRVAQIAATTSAASTANSADTATAVQQDSMTATAKAVLSATANANAAIDSEISPTATITPTATLTFTPTVTSTATPITPPLACLDRWTLKLITEDTSLSTDPTSENGCITGYKAFGISTSASKLSFLQNSFGTQGKFGLITPLPKDPKTVSLKVNFADLSGGGQGEFWITLSNGPEPDKDSMSIALQPNGSLKYYQDGNEKTRHTLQPGLSSYTINLTIKGIDVISDVNSSSSTLSLPVNGGPRYLFIGYSKKASGGTITLKIDVSNLEFK